MNPDNFHVDKDCDKRGIMSDFSQNEIKVDDWSTCSVNDFQIWWNNHKGQCKYSSKSKNILDETQHVYWKLNVA